MAFLGALPPALAVAYSSCRTKPPPPRRRWSAGGIPPGFAGAVPSGVPADHARSGGLQEPSPHRSPFACLEGRWRYDELAPDACRLSAFPVGVRWPPLPFNPPRWISYMARGSARWTHGRQTALSRPWGANLPAAACVVVLLPQAAQAVTT